MPNLRRAKLVHLLEIDGRPKAPLVELVRRHGVKVSDGVSAADLSVQLQAGWRRKVDHQFQIPDTQPADDTDWSLLSQLGLTQRVPRPLTVVNGLVPGATVPAFQRRTRFFLGDPALNIVYFLGGPRKLDPKVETRELLLDPPGLPLRSDWEVPRDFPDDLGTQTEFWAMMLLVERVQLPWKSVLSFTPEQPKEGGGVRLPGYLDTLRTLRDENPPPSHTILAVSVGAPYTLRYQYNTEEVLLPDNGYEIVACGDEAPRTFALPKFLDEAATLLHTELRLFRPVP